MTVGLVIVSHSSQLAEGVTRLAGQMVQDRIRIAPAGGTADEQIGTSVDKILAAIKQVDGPDGVLILLDLGSAILSAEMALEMLDEAQRARIQLSFAPLVEGAVTAALEASLGHSLREVRLAAEKTAHVEQLQMLKPLTPVEEEPPAPENPAADQHLSPDPGSELEVACVLTNPTGLHARPASLFVQTATRFDTPVRVLGRGRESMASSMIGILSLGLRQGDTLTLRAHGPQAQTVLDALAELVHANFYEQVPDTTAEPATMWASADQPSQPSGISWHGITTSKGVAIGPAFLYTAEGGYSSDIEQLSISAEQITTEQQQLRTALEQAAQDLRSLATDVAERAGQAQGAIFEAQALMLVDPNLALAAAETIQSERIDAASALARAGEGYAHTLEQMDDPLFAARAADIRDAVGRAIARLRGQGTVQHTLTTPHHPVILIAQDLTPSDTAQLRPELVLGICTVAGGPTAHAAILARALDIPAMAGLDATALQHIQPGDEVGLDASNALLYLHPTSAIRDSLTRQRTQQQEQRAFRVSAAQHAAIPLSFAGSPIHLMANIGSAAEAEAAREWGAEGVGLLRTEFLFASATQLPDMDEQRKLYTQIFQAFNGETERRPLVVRTLDAGADKPMPALQNLLGQRREENPALGLRGIRIHLAHPTLLEQQISALLLAAGDTGTQLRIMFPMITTVEELQSARAIFEHTYERLRQRQEKLPDQVPVGIMVEVPAAAIMARELAELADFFSIGANDLAQYTLACDRTGSSVSNLYQTAEPALLRLIHQIAQAGRQVGRPVAVCGEIAGDVQLAPLLIGLGVDELSMSPGRLPEVRAVLQRTPAEQLESLAKRSLTCKTAGEVAQLLAELPSITNPDHP